MLLSSSCHSPPSPLPLAQDFDPFHTPHLPFHFWKLPKGQLISKASISLASEKLVLDAPLTLPKATILQALPPALAKSFLSLPHSNHLRMKGCAVVWPRTSPQSPSPSQQSQGHAAPPQSCASCQRQMLPTSSFEALPGKVELGKRPSGGDQCSLLLAAR